MNRYPSLGITGGMGCGKSEVGRILAELGVAVIDADHVAHDLLRSDEATQRAVIALCGSEICGPDGQLSRKAIAGHVFGHEGRRKALEAILHPRVWEQIRTWREEKKCTEPTAALIPLLYEAGLTEGWDSIWCVAASDERVLERLRGRGWDMDEINRRRHAQWPLEEKMKRADVVIMNDGSRDALKEAVLSCWNQLLKRSR